jgi:hypothetical protein
MRYFYVVLEGQNQLSWRIISSAEDFPLHTVMKDHPNKIVTFWVEITEEQAANLIYQKKV